MKEPRSKSLPLLVETDEIAPFILSARLEKHHLMLTKGDESRSYNFASSSFFLTNTSLCLRYLSVGWQPVANTLKLKEFCNLLFYSVLDVLQ